MSFFWGDSFDLYALPADALLGYWDAGTLTAVLAAGRFSGSRGWSCNSASSTAAVLQKSSGSNDAVHHLTLAIQQTSALSGTTNYNWFQLLDGATAQCTVVFRSDGVLLLNSGGSAGTTLATYTGALTAINTWYAFEIEVVINNTTGSIAIRKNGNTSNDFSLGSLNTRGGTANNYANRLVLGNTIGSPAQTIDDLLWRSDAASVPWVGDIRCYTRRPASDAAVQWTPSGAVVPVTPVPATSGSTSMGTSFGIYHPVVAACDGAVGTVTLNFVGAATASYKCTIFASSGTAPTAILGSATVITNPGVGTASFVFPTPVPVTRGTQYWIGFAANASSGFTSTCTSAVAAAAGYTPLNNSQSYAGFPVANPTSLSADASRFVPTMIITPSGSANFALSAEPQQDAATTYVYSATVGQTDQYTLTGAASVPTTVVGVTTRGLFQKSDAGTRNAVVQLKSGGTTVESASTALNTTWGWIARTDLTDPATAAAWTPGGVSTAQVGARVAA